MDPSRRPPAPDQQHPPPSSNAYAAATFPILVITTLGILTTAILLVSYYVFVIKCCLNLHGSSSGGGGSLLRRVLSPTRSPRRRGRHYIPPVVTHAMATDVLGLEPSVIRSIPVIRFTKPGDADAGRRPLFHECAVCLSEFQEEERLKLLPSCSHAFHIDCIDTWLQFNAKCPLCRSEVTITAQLAADHIVVLAPRQGQLQGESTVIEVRDEVSNPTPRAAAAVPSPSPRKKGKKFYKAGSVGDECIDVRAGNDEQFHVQPMRRSISMDSSNDRQLYLSVQEFLRQNQHHFQGVGAGNGEECSSSGGGGEGGSSGRIRRSFFSFSWSSRSSTHPMKIDV